MASLKALSANPTFQAKVGLPQAGGPDFEETFTFRYRTKVELDAFDEELAKLENADAVLAMCTGWGFEEPFTRENIEEMLQRSIGAAVAIHRAYKGELVKVRLGNFGA